MVLNLLIASAVIMPWRPIGLGVLIPVSVTAAASLLRPSQASMVVLLAVIALGMTLAIAADDPVGQIGATTPVGTRPRLVVRAVVAAMASGIGLLTLAGIAASVGVNGDLPIVRLWACSSVLTLTAAALTRRFLPNVPGLAAGSIGLVLVVGVSTLMRDYAGSWVSHRPLAAQLGATTLLAAVGLAYATRDPGRPSQKRPVLLGVWLWRRWAAPNTHR